MGGKILINNLGNFAHALPIKAEKINYEIQYYSNRSQLKLEELSKLGEITYVNEGLYKNKKIKISTIKKLGKEIFKEIDYFILSNYATNHKYFFENFGQYLNENHEIILISPGVGAAIEMNEILKTKNLNSYPKLTEVDTCPFACKILKLGFSYIKSEKKEILYTSIRGLKNKICDNKSLIKKLFPNSKFINNSLMNLDDSTCFHVVGMLVNAQRIKNKEDFNFYINVGMEKSSNLMVEFDKERCDVANKLRIPFRNIKSWLNIVYGVKIEKSLYSMITKTPPYMNTKTNNNRSPAPKTLKHRYLEEEIPLKVVPTYYLGRKMGFEMSLHKKFIEEASLLLFNDKEYYFKNGRKLNI